MSFIKGRSLIVSLGRILTSDSMRGVFSQGNVFPKIYLHSSCIYKQENEAFNEYYSTTEKLPKNFGQVVDLGDDFSEVKVPEERKTKERSVRRKYKAFTTAEETVQESLDKLQSSSEPQEKAKKSVKTTTYDATDRNEKLLSSLMVSLKSNKRREARKEIFVEGKRLISDAISAGLIPKKIFFTRAIDLEDIGLPKETQCFRVSYKASQLWSDTEKSQGVMGVFDISDLINLKPQTDCTPLTVLCDNIRDPGNMGSVLRVAAGVGCEKVILTAGCVDIWGQKVLRAGAGAHFRLPVLKNQSWSSIESEISEESDVFLADGNSCNQTVNNLEGNSENCSKFTNESNESLPATSCFSVEFKNNNTVIIIGGETHGISQEAYEFAQKRNGMRVFIPLHNKVESLNTGVALGILSYEFKRQLSRMRCDSDSSTE